MYTKGTTTLQNVSMVVSISLPRILQSILLANDDDKGRGNGGGGDGFDWLFGYEDKDWLFG